MAFLEMKNILKWITHLIDIPTGWTQQKTETENWKPGQ